jgi:signal transduction histidine kinase/ActR/RegA family two-component response regulator
MYIMFLLGLVSLTLQFAMALALGLLGRAPRWRHAWWFAGVAITAGMYSTVDAAGALWAAKSEHIGWSLRANLFNGTLHGAAWLLFTHLGPNASWQEIPRGIRRAAVWGVAAVALVVLSPSSVVASNGATLIVPRLGDVIPHAQFTTLGTVFTLVPLTLLAVSWWQFVKRWRAGEPGTAYVLLGFAVFFATVVEEVLVAAGVIQFLYLADIGYIAVVTPVTVNLLRGFVRDARELDELQGHLADEVERRTVERDEARHLVVEQQRLAALGRLAAGVGHEINSPLQYLRLSLDEVAQQASVQADPVASEYLAHAVEGVDRVHNIVDALRTYSRPAGSDHAVVNLHDVLQAALRVGASQWRGDVTMHTTFDAVPPVHGHEGRLVQAVLNALVNAVHAVTARPVSAAREVWAHTGTTVNGWAEIVVRDNGAGFAPEVLSRIGEPFVTTRADQGGTGLGMFVLRGIVQNHGGVLLCSNTDVGGAEVRLQFPAADAPSHAASSHASSSLATVSHESSSDMVPSASHNAAQPVAQVATPQARTSLPIRHAIRVLMVEDDAASLRAYVRGLGAEGCEVQGFTDAESALAWLASHAVDIVVTDLMMPGMSGAEFAERLESSHPELRESLIVLTGGAVSAEAEAFLASDSILVLEKPIGRSALVTRIRERLAAVHGPDVVRAA